MAWNVKGKFVTERKCNGIYRGLMGKQICSKENKIESTGFDGKEKIVIEWKGKGVNKVW